MRIDLPVHNRFNNSFETVIKADIVDVAPHLASVATFAVHRTPWRDEPNGWRVSNVETGSYVITQCATREEAVAVATVRLKHKTLADVVGAMKERQRQSRKDERRAQRADADRGCGDVGVSALKDIPLADRLWNRVEVAEYLHYKPRTLERVAAKPGFPRPARPGNPTVWLAGDIIEWVRLNTLRKK